MASCQTSRWASTSPYVVLTVTESASTGSTSTLSWTLQYVSDYVASTSIAKSYKVKIDGDTVKDSTYDINGVTGTKTISSGTKTITKTTSSQTITFEVSFAFNLTWSGEYRSTLSASGSISVSAKTSYTIKYNANGGSGAPSSQTKWYGTTLVLSSTKPTRTGYTFSGWATSSTGSVAYASGANYTANASATLYAVWTALTYTVKYNANGGSGAPSNQTKTYGKTLTLSSTKPTRTNYTFKGWGTSSSSTTVSYAAGASYTKNSSITLYAIWELSYKKPRVSSLSMTRCDSSGDTTSEEVTCALIKFNWATDKTVTSITIKWKLATASTFPSGNSVTVSSSGTSGTVSEIIGASSLDVEKSYTIQIQVADGSGAGYTTTITRNFSGTFFPIDFHAGGDGVAFGKPAERSGVDFGMNVILRNSKLLLGGTNTGEFITLVQMSASNNSLFGYGSYVNSIGASYFDGNVVHIRSKGDITLHGSRTVLDNGDALASVNADGTSYINMAYVTSANNLILGGGTYKPSNIYIRNTYDGLVFADYSATSSVNPSLLYPESDGTCALGTSAHRWYRVYAANSTISTSDKRRKENIYDIGKRKMIDKNNKEVEVFSELFDRLQPSEYNFIGGDKRIHFGLVAQDVLEIMKELGIEENELDLVHHDVFVDPETEKKEDTFGIAYENLIAMLIYEVQKLKKGK